jgi:transcriptional regulator with XRE-family HTH domain
MAGWSQERLGDAAHVTQSTISRFERALAPSMDVEKLLWLSAKLHPNFPVGYCPHIHYCPWQAIPLAALPVGVGPPQDPDRARINAMLEKLRQSEDGDRQQ